MASFEIDTGVTEFDPRNLVPDWFIDQCAAGTATDRLIHDYAYHKISAMNDPAKMDTVRKHVLMDWQFLRHLAAVHPAVFDEFWESYAERLNRP